MNKQKTSSIIIVVAVLVAFFFSMAVFAEETSDYKVNIDFVVWDKESKFTVLKGLLSIFEQ